MEHRRLPEITYQLHLRINRPLKVVVGRLGEVDLPAGDYLYTGSAKKHMDARIARHLRRDKPLRWHIDYLTSHPDVEVVGVKRSVIPECALNQAVAGEVVVPGFGSSDCRHHCGAHLKRIG
ncbi:MAG: GIY-YIG nuclease family protein [Zoogloeaceae bacterium]|nr:GIY-YIG nuclease family protein [Zoogloeaceae bacterium]